jgi:hypothetical protein
MTREELGEWRIDMLLLDAALANARVARLKELVATRQLERSKIRIKKNRATTKLDR